MEFDPRDYDSRDDERLGDGRERGGRGEYRDRDDDDLRLPEVHIRDHDDEARELARGAGDDSRQSNECEDGRGLRDDARWPDCNTREREFEPREVFTRGLTLPRGPEREIVQQRNREYTLRGSESRSLATVGADHGRGVAGQGRAAPEGSLDARHRSRTMAPEERLLLHDTERCFRRLSGQCARFAVVRTRVAGTGSVCLEIIAATARLRVVR